MPGVVVIVVFLMQGFTEVDFTHGVVEFIVETTGRSKGTSVVVFSSGANMSFIDSNGESKGVSVAFPIGVNTSFIVRFEGAGVVLG